MTDFIGTMDYQSELRKGQSTLYGAYLKPGHYWGMPERISLPTNQNNGLADLQLTLIRATIPKPRTYGLLNLGLQMDYSLADTTVEPDNVATPVTILPALLTYGYLRLTFEEMAFEQELSWNGLGQTQLRLPLRAEAATMVKQALADGILLPQSTVAIAISGLASRSIGTISFDPTQMLTFLQDAHDENESMTYAGLQHFLALNWERLPVQWHLPNNQALPDQVEPWLIALLDRIIARYAVLSAPATDEPLAYLDFVSSIRPGHVQWRLDDLLTTWRPLVLQWNPLAIVQQQIAQHGLTPFLQELDTPPLPSHTLEVTVIGNLPAHRSNILRIGAHISAPPQLPWRRHTVHKTASFDEPNDTITLRLKLGFRASVEIKVQPFVVLTTAQGFETFEGQEREEKDNLIELSVTDYPVTFYAVSAEPALLNLADLTGALVWQEGDMQQRVFFQLDSLQPTTTLAIPETIDMPILVVTAQAHDTQKQLPLEPVLATNGYLTRWQLPGFGAHTVRFSADTPPSTPIEIAVEAEDGTTRKNLFLRTDKTTADWSYVALNPFQAGFRHRRLPEGVWSPVLSPLTQSEVSL